VFFIFARRHDSFEDESIRPAFLPAGQVVERLLVEPPFGHVLVHEGYEAGVVGRAPRGVDQFVDDEIFEALGRLLGEVGVEADAR